MKRAVQSDLSLDHVHGAAAVAQKGKEWWHCFENQWKQTPKKSIPREKRLYAEFLLSCYLVSENRFTLTCS